MSATVIELSPRNDPNNQYFCKPVFPLNEELRKYSDAEDPSQ